MTHEPTPHTAAKILICEDEIMFAKDNVRTLSVFQDGFEVRRSSIISLELVILSLLISVTFSEAYSSENDTPLKPTVLPSKILKTIIVPDYYPYTFVNDHGKPDGFSVDLANAVAQAMDMKLEISAGTWEHAREALENGTIDFLPMMAASPLRRQSFDFSVPHTIAYDAAFVRRGTQTANSLNDLSGKTVFVMNKDAAHDVISASPSSDTMKLILVDSLPDGLRLLASGEGDAAIMPKLVGLLLVKKLGITNVEASPATIGAYKRPFSFAVKKGNTALLEALSQGLSIVKADGRYHDIYEKWFGVLDPPGLPWRLVVKYILGIVVASALVGMILLVWSLSLRKMVTQRTRTLESEILVRKKTEATLRESEERFRLAMEATNDGVWDWDLANAQVFRSEAFFPMVGYKPEDFSGRVGDWQHLVHPDDLQTVQQELGECLAGKREAHEVEFRVRTKSGDTVWILSRGKVVVRDENGKPVRMTGTHTDITERKKAEEQIQKQASLMESLLEAIPAPVFYKDTDHVYRGCNDAFAELFGLPKENIVGKSVFAVAPKELAEIYKNHDKALFQNPGTQVYESSVNAINGSMRNVMFHKATFTDASGEVAGLIGVILDITERKRAEEALLESEERYRQITENSLAGIFVYQDGRSVYANRRLAEMLGYNPEEILRIPFLDAIHPDDRQLVQQMAKDRLSGEVVPNHYELRLLHKDGHTVWSEVLSHLIDYRGRQAILGNVADVTQSRTLEEQLRQAQKMEAVGTLAGGIAHDFNNLLHIISGHAELLDMELAERKLKFGELDAIRQSAHRGADLVKQILTFSRRIGAKFESIDLNEEVRSTERLLYRTIPKMIDIELRLEEGLDRVRVDSTQIEQMLINLSVNAKDAMPEGGRLVIETRNVNLDEQYCKSHSEILPGQYVLLRVSDTGHGMEEEVLRHIFEPFFTTKGLADGTGLGLATAFGIVKIHKGHITCESEVGRGTTFSIYFPAAEAGKPDMDQEREVSAVAGGTESILVVDDEPMIRDLAKRVLEKSGYSVLTAGSGKEGIEVYTEHKSDISLVILDLIMPEMGGKQCLEELLKINPQVKALIASGFAVRGDTKTFLDTEAKGIVPKPFNIRELLRSVRHVLDGM
jgi:two-component system, cell cycle sensor histidine kinase and response regulator CckA